MQIKKLEIFNFLQKIFIFCLKSPQSRAFFFDDSVRVDNEAEKEYCYCAIEEAF